MAKLFDNSKIYDFAAEFIGVYPMRWYAMRVKITWKSVYLISVGKVKAATFMTEDIAFVLVC